MARNPSQPHPDWALAHRRPGTELRLINGRYYLYEYKTVYDSQKKKPKKVSGPLLGSITQNNGFRPSAKRKLEKEGAFQLPQRILCKEYGMALTVAYQLGAYLGALRKVFGEDWKDLAAVAYCRFVHRCPLKSIPYHLSTSYLPELLDIRPFGDKHASGILKRIGGQREKMLGYMRSFISKDDFILMDATDIFSSSAHIPLAQKGYNSRMQFDKQFNLMYIYSSDQRMPVYYRLLPGNIRDVKAFRNCLLEAGIQNAVLVADKGFYSKENVGLLSSVGLEFILPLKRNSSLVAYQSLEDNSFKDGAVFFTHEKRVVWCEKKALGDGLFLYLYLDESLRNKEESDYVFRIGTHPENHSRDGYLKKRNRFGTLAVLSSLDGEEASVYQTYKSRMAIEVMFDGMKTVLEADHTYMQDEQTLQGWMFVNHLALQWYQHLYLELKEKELLKVFSVNDYVKLLGGVKKIRINDEWYLNEFPNQTRKFIEKMGIQIV
jgi:hypothetical protein